ncbi:copper chaperone PCu(A)C [uncultured Halopseudomonas sp.]|uniref:copper chaperone PCu(A)C n=1 Tax=uncultured Halopseudomonas sp. TaxID=2901193 RepID=UPI0030ED81E4|tara:strand:- start:53491 stop:53997 length:507 start_codon:yes stop_codon:yes gene_type:complete
MLLRTLSSFFCALLLAGPALAHDYQVADLHIAHSWARPLPPVVPSGAAYLHIENRGTTADTLVAASSPIADKVEVHEHVHVDGLMKMQEVEQLSIEPGADVVFEPGGYHFMMFGLKQPLEDGGRFPLTLVFENAGSIEVDVMIEKEAPAPTDHGAHSAKPEQSKHQHH